MKRERPTVISTADRNEIFARAIAEGRHNADMSTWRTVCDGCREWVKAIWFVNEQGAHLCRACSPKDRHPSLLKDLPLATGN